ncbi:unnamed protein product [Umbelopsis vinacea]
MSVLNRIEDLLEISQNASIMLQQKVATEKDSPSGILLNADDYTPTSPVSLSLLAAKSHPLAPISSTSAAAPVIPHERPSHVLKDEPRDTASVQCNKIDKADDNEEDAEEFVDAVEEMSTPISAQTIQLEDQLQTFSIDSSVPLKRSNSNFSLFSLPPNAIWDPSIGETVSGDPMTKSLTIEDYFPVPTRALSATPTAVASASTPIPTTRGASSINLFNVDNEITARHNDVFASDVEVSHPLRIGVGYGSYVCYSCTIFSSKGTSITARKRYSDFVQLRDSLVEHYPRLKNNLPKLPPKKVVGRFTPSFIEKRRRELEYFLKYVSLHPTLGSSMEVKRWLTQ